MKKLLLYIIFILITICSAMASEIVSDREMPMEYYRYIDSANTFLAKNPAKSLIYLEKALKICLANRPFTEEYECYLKIAQANKNLKQIDQAIKYYQKLIVNDKSMRWYQVSYHQEGLKGLANCYELKNEYLLAEGYINQLIRDKNFSANNQDWLNVAKGRLAYKRGDYKNAETYLLKVTNKKSKAKTNNSALLVEANDYLSQVYAAQNDKQKSRKYLSSSMDIAEKIEDKKLYKEQANKLKDAYKADNELNKSLEVSEEIIQNGASDIESKQAENIDNAKIYIQQNKIEKAIPLLQSTIYEANKEGLIQNKKEAYKALSKAYEKQGNTDKALENYRIYVHLQDSLYNHKVDSLNTAINTQTGVSEINQRIGLLEKDKQLQDKTIHALEAEKSFQKALIYSLIAILLIIIVSSYLLYKNIRQKKIANQLLALKSLRSQMNPHFIFNALNSVNSFISANDQRTANKYLADFSKLMRAVLENSQKDFVALSEEIDVLQLYLKLEHFRFSNKFDYTFEVDDEISVDQYKIPPMLIQPYIENAVWHGLRYVEEKGLLQVHIGVEEHCITVEIKDNGIGRKKSQELKTHNQKQNESMGLKNIETRLAIINDIYKTDLKVKISDLDSENGSGTIVHVSIPFIKEK